MGFQGFGCTLRGQAALVNRFIIRIHGLLIWFIGLIYLIGSSDPPQHPKP